MTLERMLDRWKGQAAYDDDEPEVEERVTEFLREGLQQVALKRLDNDLSDLAAFENGEDEPDARIPEWMHPAIVDYALYMWFRDGNLVKQQRAQAYLGRFHEFVNAMPTYKDDEAKKGQADGRWALKNKYSY